MIPSFDQISLWVYLLFGGLLVAVVCQLFFYFYYYNKVSSTAAVERLTEVDCSRIESKPVSVIVYSMNESDHLRELIPALFNQQYPEFEVVVVNDGSTDDTRELVEEFQTRYPHLRLSNVPVEARCRNRKKLALNIAMKGARYDLFLHTEANCLPVSDQWIARMVAPVERGVDIVVGAYTYDCRRVFGRRLMMFDHLMFSLRYLSRALRGGVYMGCGKNLCYTRSLFEGTTAFANFLNLPWGDDDLFVNETATTANSRAVVSTDAIVSARFHRVRKAWSFAKNSYFLSATRFEGNDRYLFSIETYSRYLFWFSWVGGIAATCMQPLLVLLFVVPGIARQITQALVLRKSARLFRLPASYFYLPLLELTQPFVNFYFWLYRNRDRRPRRI